jgi:hypothetical protein
LNSRLSPASMSAGVGRTNDRSSQRRSSEARPSMVEQEGTTQDAATFQLRKPRLGEDFSRRTL